MEPIAISSSSTGFGFSDKPQPRYGFDYTLDGNFCIKPMIAISKLFEVIKY